MMSSPTPDRGSGAFAVSIRGDVPSFLFGTRMLSMNPGIRPLLASLTLLLVAGCASTTKIQVQRAPEIDLPGVRSLQVEPISTTGGLDLDQISTGGGLLGVALDVAVNVGTNVVASRQDGKWSDWSTADLRGALVRNGTFEVRETKDADAILKGSCEYDVRDVPETIEEKVDGKVVSSYKIERTATARVRFEVVAPDGKVLGAGNVEQARKVKVEEADAETARDRIPDWEDLVHKAIADANEKVVSRIAPYYVTEERTFAKAGSKSIEKGNKLAAKGDWDGAATLWRQALEGNSQDRSSGLFNLAIRDESRGDLDSALAKYEASKAAKSQKGIEISLQRVRSRIQERERLRAAAALRDSSATRPNP